MEVPIWNRLDRGSAWKEFSDGLAVPGIAERVANFQPQAVLGVDWTSLSAYQALSEMLTELAQPVPPYIFMNYR